MNPVRVMYVQTEMGKKKSMFTYESVDGGLLAHDIENCINDMREKNFFFLKLEPVRGVRALKGSMVQTTIGYLLFFEERSS